MYKYYVFTCLLGLSVGLWLLVKQLLLINHPHTAGFVAFIAAIMSIGTMCYGYSTIEGISKYKMIFSFKPLKEEYWLNEEQLRFIYGLL